VILGSDEDEGNLKNARSLSIFIHHKKLPSTPLQGIHLLVPCGQSTVVTMTVDMVDSAIFG
jgi:hypothetical protein